jgi:hypothetical protein
MPSYLIDFYDLMTFYTNILLVTTVTAVNMNISLVLITVIFFNKHIAWYSILIDSILDIFRYYIQYSITFSCSSKFSLNIVCQIHLNIRKIYMLWNTRLIYILHKSSVSAQQKTNCLFIIKTIWLFRKVIITGCKKNMKCLCKTLWVHWRLSTLKAGGI